jgi:anaerobic selenocysteine-containing dehydrogenase
MGMIHVLLEEGLYDASFVREWTNGAFLVREDTHQLLTEQDLAPSGHPETFFVWDGRSGGPVGYHTGRGYTQDDVAPALSGAFACTLGDGQVVACRPAFELLKALAAEYTPERSEGITWVPAGSLRRAVRMFATEQPSCYATWVGLEQHTNAMQTSTRFRCKTLWNQLSLRNSSP